MLIEPIIVGKEPKDTRVVVAMSGGVDSSVVAAILKENGYDVIGLTMQLYDHGQAVQKKNACCAGADIYDARRVADMLNFPHYVLDYESRFRESVIEEFADSYLRGETPIPCIRCNQTVKFIDLMEMAKKLGGDALATGHYVQRIQTNKGLELHKGMDPSRDQSYFLFATTMEQLNFVRFPLGHISKSETRAHAKRLGLEVCDKPDSQDICFVPEGKYADVVEKIRPNSVRAGEIIDKNGNVLGNHNGVINYTIGQRKGLGVSRAGDPYYVTEIKPETNQVIIGERSDLNKSMLLLYDVNMLCDLHDLQSNIMIRFRSSQEDIPASIEIVSNQRAFVKLHEPQAGISPGQACVFYKNQRVLGGGWIHKTS